MKFLAILQDSVREAIDSTVFFVMLGLSCLTVLLVGSISYRPVALEEEVKDYTNVLSWVLQRQQARNKDKQAMPGTPARIFITDFAQTNPGAPPWQGDYRFTLNLEFPQAEGAALVKALQAQLARDMRRALHNRFWYLLDLEVSPEKSDDPAQVRYAVTSRGTAVDSRKDWDHELVVLFAFPVPYWHKPLSAWVHLWEYGLVNWIGGGIALLLSVIITAFFIPNMLRKGTVDLLLVKPIHRTTLLLFKYVGGLSFMFLNTVVVVVGIWLVLGLRTGLWGTGFLVSILVLTYEFAIYYAVSTLFAVLTRSTIVAILLSCLSWALFAVVVGYGYHIIDATRNLQELVAVSGQEMPDDAQPPDKLLPEWVYATADVVHLVTPHLNDLDLLTSKLIVDDLMSPESRDRRVADKQYANFRWTETMTISTLYIVVLLGISCWWFATKDY